MLFLKNRCFALGNYHCIEEGNIFCNFIMKNCLATACTICVNSGLRIGPRAVGLRIGPRALGSIQK